MRFDAHHGVYATWQGRRIEAEAAAWISKGYALAMGSIGTVLAVAPVLGLSRWQGFGGAVVLLAVAGLLLRLRRGGQLIG